MSKRTIQKLEKEVDMLKLENERLTRELSRARTNYAAAVTDTQRTMSIVGGLFREHSRLMMTKRPEATEICFKMHLSEAMLAAFRNGRQEIAYILGEQIARELERKAIEHGPAFVNEFDLSKWSEG